MPITAFDTWHAIPRLAQPHTVTDFARHRGDDFIRAVLGSPTMWPDAALGVRREYHQAHALAHLYEGRRPPAEPGGRAPSWFLTRDPRKLSEIARYVVAHTPHPAIGTWQGEPTATFQMRELPPGFMGRVTDDDIIHDIDILASEGNPTRDPTIYSANRRDLGFPSLTAEQSAKIRGLGSYDPSMYPYVGFHREFDGSWGGPVSGASITFQQPRGGNWRLESAQPYGVPQMGPPQTYYRRGGYIPPSYHVHDKSMQAFGRSNRSQQRDRWNWF